MANSNCLFESFCYWSSPRLLCGLRIITKVFSSTFYMGRFNGPTSKRHKLWSGSKSVLEDIVDGATYMPRALRLRLPGKPLVHKYVDSKGKKGYAGIPKALKDSQTLGFKLQKHILFVIISVMNIVIWEKSGTMYMLYIFIYIYMCRNILVRFATQGLHEGIWRARGFSGKAALP